MLKFYRNLEEDNLNALQLREYVDQWKCSEEYSRLEKMEAYYRTKNTTIMNRVLENSDINNKVATGYAKYITTVINGYMFGSKDCISYVFNNDNEEFERILKYNDSVSVDKNIGQLASIYGYGIEQYYIDDNEEFRFKDIDPKNIIIFFDDTIEENITEAIKYREYEFIDEKGLTRYKLIIEYYTMDNIYEYTFIDNSIIAEESIDYPNIFGDIPFTIYENPDLMGDFENVITLIDSIDKAMADNSNTFEYYNDAYIIFKNCDLPLGAEGEEDPGIMLKTSKGFQIPNADGEIYFLEKPKISADSIQYSKELEDKLFKFSMVPDLTSPEYLQAQSGTAMRLKLTGLEFIACNKEALFRKGLFRRLEIMSNVKNISTESKIDFTDIEIIFKRNTVESLSEIVDTAMKLKSIVSTETLLDMIPYCDKDEELERLKKEKESNMMMFNMQNNVNSFFNENDNENKDEEDNEEVDDNEKE